MMFRKWMIGACVAVAAMAIGGEAEAVETLICPSSVQVTNYSAKPVKVEWYGQGRATAVVAPNNTSLVCPSFAGDSKSSVSVTAGNLPARKFNISTRDVRKLYERSGFTPKEAALVVHVRVNKYGVVELRRIYLRKQMPSSDW